MRKLPSESYLKMSTNKQISANRENAEKSTGPVTAEGKATSSHNAVKTGLTGQTVLLKTDDVIAYSMHIERFTEKFQPVTGEECALVQDLADTEWRLLRIPSLESGILALGRMELAEQVAQADESLREVLLEAKVYLVYEKPLKNLSLQHTRLRRHRKLVIDELTTLQQDRKARAEKQADRAAMYLLREAENLQPFELSDFGFDFTLQDMYESYARMRARVKISPYPELVKNDSMEVCRTLYNELMAQN